MDTYECTECGKEIETASKPIVPCKCGARGKWVKCLDKPKQKGFIAKLFQLAVQGLSLYAKAFGGIK